MKITLSSFFIFTSRSSELAYMSKPVINKSVGPDSPEIAMPVEGLTVLDRPRIEKSGNEAFEEGAAAAAAEADFVNEVVSTRCT